MKLVQAAFRRLPLGSLLEAGTLFSVLVIAGAGLLFAEVVDEVLEGESRAFDTAVLLALRDPHQLGDPIGPTWLENAFRDITALGGKAVVSLMTAAVIGFLLLTGKPAAAVMVLVSVSGGALLSTLLKLGFDRPRPDLVAHLIAVESASFPSGHALLSAVTYLTLGALLARVVGQLRLKLYVLGVALVLTFLIGLSRIYLGVHWPTDVLAGWSAGAVWAVLCWRVALALQRRGEIETGGG
ncbi:MAG TPA: phosphatase PAP2 family protein [Candidatus Eisenbacteria bacterium]|nr:phosphatase PAP2 family protein [Candidatus Eisenbacteria bacterium]